MNVNSQFIRIIVIFNLVIILSSIVIQLPLTKWQKCFRTQSSLDKSLQIKFGLLKKYKNTCELIFSINQRDKFDKIIQNIYEQPYYCSQANPANPVVIKHNSQQLSFGGYYSICIQIVNNMNTQALVQIFIGQKLNPLTYNYTNSHIPLVRNYQLMDLEMTVEAITRSLANSQNYISQSQQVGDKLDVKIDDLMSYNNSITILQIVLLLIFGTAWIIIVIKIKSSH